MTQSPLLTPVRGRRFRTAGSFLLAWICACVTLAGCDTGLTSWQQIEFPESNISYSQHVGPLFDVSCMYSGCHNSIDRAGSITLEEYVDLFSVPGLLHPGDSTSSLLWQVVSERLPHSAAPMLDLMSARQQHGIALWIQEGAFNN